ncbi:MAG: complement resistance protein TraT, partial [Desulfovibrionaceae bacterium]|nr:complement resistance protein TraT [Desulfovibrionaceae bacterium]
MSRLRLLIVLPLSLWLCGCAATQVALEKKDLKVETQMSSTIFLDIENQRERSVFVDVRNTTGKDIDIRERIVGRLRDKGYAVVESPQRAFLILQANILYVGMADPSALHESLYAGYGGVLAGGLGGALIGGA